jgi:protein SCO1/2
MKQRLTIWLFVAAVVIVPASVLGVMKWFGQRYVPLPVLGPENHRTGAFSFLDQDGRTVSEEDWEGKIVVANFFFTHCPSICPRMMKQLQRVQDRYKNSDLLICSFSVDPERDSVGRLKEYADRLKTGTHWHLLTGDKKALYRFARNGLMITATDGDGGPEDFIHSDNLVLIDRQQRIRGFYSGTDEQDVNRLIKDIQKLSNERK